MTGPPLPPPEPEQVTIGRLAGSLGALGQQVADLRRRLDTMARQLDTARVGQLGAELDALAARFEELSATVTAALEAAAPGGPAAPRWDGLGEAERAAALGRLRDWVRDVLVPEYLTGGPCTPLPRCWAEHEPVLWELSSIAADWQRIYGRPRPGPLKDALEWLDRWLPGAMRRVDTATANCRTGHTA